MTGRTVCADLSELRAPGISGSGTPGSALLIPPTVKPPRIYLTMALDRRKLPDPLTAEGRQSFSATSETAAPSAQKRCRSQEQRCSVEAKSGADDEAHR